MKDEIVVREYIGSNGRVRLYKNTKTGKFTVAWGYIIPTSDNGVNHYDDATDAIDDYNSRVPSNERV